MKTTLFLSSLLLTSAQTIALGQASANPEAAVVAGQEQRWLQSQRANDPRVLNTLLADSFVNTGSDGKVVDKAGEIAGATSSKWLTAAYNHLKVTVYGNVAIATGGITGRLADNKSGKVTAINDRWTDTWLKMPSGQWQCVASQVTSIK